jgi:hypothetical protein
VLLGGVVTWWLKIFVRRLIRLRDFFGGRSFRSEKLLSTRKINVPWLLDFGSRASMAVSDDDTRRGT